MLNTARKMRERERERNIKGKLYAAIADSHLSVVSFLTRFSKPCLYSNVYFGMANRNAKGMESTGVQAVVMHIS